MPHFIPVSCRAVFTVQKGAWARDPGGGKPPKHPRADHFSDQPPDEAMAALAAHRFPLGDSPFIHVHSGGPGPSRTRLPYSVVARSVEITRLDFRGRNRWSFGVDGQAELEGHQTQQTPHRARSSREIEAGHSSEWPEFDFFICLQVWCIHFCKQIYAVAGAPGGSIPLNRLAVAQAMAFLCLPVRPVSIVPMLYPIRCTYKDAPRHARGVSHCVRLNERF